jgi:hypothetical protein
MTFTNFPNGVTSFGIPLFGGGGAGPLSIPNGNGQVLFVDGSGAFSLSGNLTYSTIQDAVDACTSGAGSTIIVFPGTYDENVTVSSDAVSIIGAQFAGYERPDLTPTAGVALAVQGQGFNCSNMRFASADSDTVQQHGNGFSYINCVFDGDAGQAATEGCLRLVGAVDDSHTASEGYVGNCLFRGSTSGAGIIFQYSLAAAGGVGVSDNVIDNCRFYANGVDLLSATNTNGGGAGIFLNLLVQNCKHLTVGAAYVYYDMDQGAAGDLSANSALFCNNYFADEALIAAQIDISGQANCMFVGNYDCAGLVNGSTFNN